jgi:hypothetical protein
MRIATRITFGSVGTLMSLRSTNPRQNEANGRVRARPSAELNACSVVHSGSVR